MINISKQKVYYADTDSFGVVWHGSYLRWLEAGRIALCEDFGYKMSELADMDIVLPVVNINIDYKASAMFEDELIVETKLSEFGRFHMIFNQVIKNANTGKVYTVADVKIVAVSKTGKLYRNLPEVLQKFCEGVIEK